MSEQLSLDDVAGRIRESLEEIQRHTAINDWERKRMRARARDHLAAFGIVELFGEIAAGLGPERVRAFTTFDEVGVKQMPWYEVVLEPASTESAPLRAYIDWLTDTVVLYPGAGGRVEMWAGRKDTAEEFVAKVARYVNAVVEGGFRATYWIKRRGTPFTITLEKGDVISAKLEFLIDGKWRRAGELLPGAPGAEKISKTYLPY